MKSTLTDVTTLKRSYETLRMVGVLLALHAVLGSALGNTVSSPQNVLASAGEKAAFWDDRSNRDATDLYLTASRTYLAENRNADAAASLIAAAEQMLIAGKTREPIATLSNALSILGSSSAEAEIRIKGIYLLSQAHLRTDNLRGARACHKKLLGYSRRRQNALALGLGYLLESDIAYQSRNIAAMIVSQENALRIFEEMQDQSLKAKTLRELAYSYVMNNEGIKGIEAGRQSVGIYRSLRDRRGLALALTAYGDANLRTGEWRIAKLSFDEAEKLFPERLDANDKGRLLTKIGMYYETFGDLERAKHYFQRAQVLYQESENLFGSTELSIVVGQILLRLGQSDEAAVYLGRGLELSKKLNDSWSLSMANEKLGEVFVKKGEFDRAESHYLIALSLIERSKTVGARNASVRNQLGHLYTGRKEIDKAIYFYTSALTLSEKIRDKAATSACLYNLAAVHELNAQDDLALEEVRRSIEITEDLNSLTLNSQLKAAYFSNVYDRYELYIRLLMRKETEKPGQGFMLAALQASERARARSLKENIQFSEANFIKGAAQETVRIERELSSLLNRKRDKLTELLSTNGQENEIKAVGDEALEIERRLEDIRAELKETSPIYSAIKDPAPFDAERFRREVLDDDSVFLEYSLGKDESYLWVIGKDEITHYTLAGREALEGKVDALLDVLRSRAQRPSETIESYNMRVREAERRYPALAADLSQDLLGAAAEKLAGKRLIIAPDGKLGYLPFGALPAPNSEKAEPLIAANEIVYSPSASILGMIKAIGEKPRNAPAKDLLVFADPVFSEADERLTGQRADQSIFQASVAMMRSADTIRNLARLPASETEAEAVAGIAGSPTVLSGFAASRERVLDENLADYRVIHFATHGILNQQHPDLSGILLSLYGRNGEPSEGFIRAQDIYGLDLNADLVVLSACDSGVGKEVRGEGIMGLNNAFLQAGARSVVSSLWKVDDNATEKLMREFYGAMAGGNSTPGQALRIAQQKMIRDPLYSSPFYWAAFTVQGNTDVKVTFSSRRRVYLWSSAAACFAAILAVWIFRRRRSRRALNRP